MAKPIKDVTLKDGSKINLSFLERADFEESLDFFRRMPLEERLYLRRDVTKREILEERVQEAENGLSTIIVAIDGESIVGDCLLFVQPHGWFKKTGEIRFAIDREYRDKGLGYVLAKEIFLMAVKKDLKKLEACVMETQVEAKRLLEKLGFYQEGVLADFVVDIRGREHDLILMGMML
jgi:RimJ/RimL family protein N-acetyltransferase